MKQFIIKRFLALLPLLFAVTLLAFVLMQLSPGDFLSQLKTNPDVSAEYIREMEEKFGLNHSWPVQYIRWLGCVIRLDFGYSWTYHIPVLTLLKQRIVATLLLSTSALLIAWLVAIPAGICAAIYRDRWPDKLLCGLSYCFLSIPEFFLALLGVFLAAKTGYLPTMGRTSIVHDFLSPGKQWLDYIQHLFLPSLVLGGGSVANLLRLTRSHFLDFLNAEFVITARAKGLSEGSIMFKHVLRNALNPLITYLGFAFSGLLSGALLVENVFNYPGLGKLLYEAFMSHDQHVVMAAVVFGCCMLIVGNLLADLLLGCVDPRIRVNSRV